MLLVRISFKKIFVSIFDSFYGILELCIFISCTIEYLKIKFRLYIGKNALHSLYRYV